MNLKPRFLLLTGFLIVVSATAAWYVAREFAENIVTQWAIHYAEKQVLYDKSRLLQPIVREIALSRQFADSKDILAWARDPGNPALTRLAFAEMENYRRNFTDHSYFIALFDNGRYYHNNAKNEFAGKQYRYTLSPNKLEDRWFYDIVQQQRDLHVNVSPDVNLGVTKMWVNVLVRDGNTILGVAGTGLELTKLIHAVVDQTQPGMTNFFVDHNGAIQAHHDQRLIDFASISKTPQNRKTLDLLFEQQSDRDAIYAAMKALKNTKNTVISHFVEIQGRRHLAGVAYLPEIDWYEITLLDLDVLAPISSFSSILVVYGLTLLLALMLFNLVLNRQVLRPLKNLENAMRKVEQGHHIDAFPSFHGRSEITRLVEHFQRMVHAQREARLSLEHKVRERTEDLDRLAKTDPLTELLNRRGMIERIEAEISRSRREHSHIGLLLLDIDLFKEINDQHGHGKGDEALRALAKMIHTMLRPYDCVARWGGDEYLVLTQASDAHDLDALGERIRAAAAGNRRIEGVNGLPLRLTLSVGGYFADSGEDMESMLHHADKALYAAKDAGRNCYRAYAGTRKAAET